MDRHDAPASRPASPASGRPAMPGRLEESRPNSVRHAVHRTGQTGRAVAPAGNAAPAQGAVPVLRTPATEVLRAMLGPMRWLGAPKGSDLSEALGGMPGDAGWMIELPGDGGLLCVTISRRLGAVKDETRVVLFQELRGYGGFTWCLAADTSESLERIRAEVQALLDGGARVVRSGRP